MVFHFLFPFVFNNLSRSPCIFNIFFFALPRPNLNPTKCLHFNNLVFNPGHAKSPPSIAKHLMFH